MNAKSAQGRASQPGKINNNTAAKRQRPEVHFLHYWALSNVAEDEKMSVF